VVNVGLFIGGVVTGIFIGSLAGVFVMCLMIIAKESDKIHPGIERSKEK
jgi:hypothetical protein